MGNSRTAPMLMRIRTEPHPGLAELQRAKPLPDFGEWNGRAPGNVTWENQGYDSGNPEHHNTHEMLNKLGWDGFHAFVATRVAEFLGVKPTQQVTATRVFSDGNGNFRMRVDISGPGRTVEGFAMVGEFSGRPFLRIRNAKGTPEMFMERKTAGQELRELNGLIGNWARKLKEAIGLVSGDGTAYRSNI